MKKFFLRLFSIIILFIIMFIQKSTSIGFILLLYCIYLAITSYINMLDKNEKKE